MRRQEGDLGAGLLALALAARRQGRRRADDGERRHRVAVLEADDMLETATEDAQLERRGERVDDRDADPVQPARNLVAVVVELAAGMQLGHHDLGRRDAFLLVDVDRDAATIIGDRHRAVGVECHRHRVAIAGERLVDGIVDHLVDHVVEARAVIGVADIHARARAHGIETAQHGDRIGAIVVTRR